jgi:predicted phage baseplate assembly protein
MPLPSPNLDDRRFQDIVDEAKRLIPRFCPEWTDHNVSDPGIALIELFAWMTDMLLYRVNQVPAKVYLKFLDLIGIRLEPPRSATAPVTFYLSTALPHELSIPASTEVATVRTETSPAIIFATEEQLTIRPPNLIGAFVRKARQSGASGWTVYDLRQLDLPGRRIAVFPPQPAPGDAFYLALAGDHSRHVLALVLECEPAAGVGIDPVRPPIEWQVWQGGLMRWAPCEVEFDGTGGFNWSGEIILHLPSMALATFQEVEGYWLRCRLTDAQAGVGAYRQSPTIERLTIESRGATVVAHHASSVTNEMIGRSNGIPGQVFKLVHTPILSRDPQYDFLIVELPGGDVQHWQEVDDFGDSRPDDRHFTLESTTGTLSLGPSLPQPDGSVNRFGATPARGAALIFSHYQYGGGVIGNVSLNTLTVLKTALPYIARVTNRSLAVGGRDQQSLEDAMLRAPQRLRTRTSAITANDYEHLARDIPGVARVICLAPGVQPGETTDPRPGEVVVVSLPLVQRVEGRIPSEQLLLSADLRAAVLEYLAQRSPIGIRLDVRPPQYIFVSVQARLRLPSLIDPMLVTKIQQQAEATLYGYLNPYIGGSRGTGWLLVANCAFLRSMPCWNASRRSNSSTRCRCLSVNPADQSRSSRPRGWFCLGPG